MFAVYPVWISCPNCRAKLVGDRFIKIQGFVVVPILVIMLCAAVMLKPRPVPHQLVLAILCTLILAVPSVLATLKWGRYLLRAPSDT
jgi:hypothetical protein